MFFCRHNCWSQKSISYTKLMMSFYIGYIFMSSTRHKTDDETWCVATCICIRDIYNNLCLFAAFYSHRDAPILTKLRSSNQLTFAFHSIKIEEIECAKQCVRTNVKHFLCIKCSLLLANMQRHWTKNLAYLNTNARHVSVHIDERGADETTTLYRIF